MATKPLVLHSSTYLCFPTLTPYLSSFNQIKLSQTLLLRHNRHHHYHQCRRNGKLRDQSRNPNPRKALPFSSHVIINPRDPFIIINGWEQNIGELCQQIRSFLWNCGHISVLSVKIRQIFSLFRAIAISLSLLFLLGARSTALASSHQPKTTSVLFFESVPSQKENGIRVSSTTTAVSHLNADGDHALNEYSADEDLESAVQREYSEDNRCNLESGVPNEYSGDNGQYDPESSIGGDVTKKENFPNEQPISSSYEEGSTQEIKEEHNDNDDNFEEFDDFYNEENVKDTSRQQIAKHQDVKDMEKVLESWSSTPYKLTVPLRVVSLRGSVPPTWIQDFRISQGKRVRTMVENQGNLGDIISALSASMEKKQIKPQSIMAADIVTIGDSWLQIAISKGLIEPIENAEKYDWFQRLSSKWQDYLRRDQDGCIDKHGRIWGVPYRWGSMVVAFRKEKLSRNNIPGIEDWEDLWRPELTGRIAMVDSPREVVGAVLKSLGASYNTHDFDKEVDGGREAVKQRFIAFRKQVRLFDNTHYLKALASDDVWVAIGWSSDVIPVAKRMSNMRVIAPKSGTSLWADLWAIPAATTIPTDKIGSRVYRASPLVQQWFDFCLQPARAEPFQQGVYAGASPLSYVNDREPMKDDQDDRIIAKVINSGGPNFDTNLIEGVPPKSSMEKSEFLEPLSDKAILDYEWLFAQVSEQESHKKRFLNLV